MAELSVQAIKTIVMAGLIMLTSLAILLPFKLVAIERRSSSTSMRARLHKVIGLLNCFAGGVFLATCFLDLLPGVQNGMREIKQTYVISTNFPLAEFTAAIGFFMILFVEQLVVMSHEQNANSDELRPLINDNSSRSSSILEGITTSGVHEPPVDRRHGENDLTPGPVHRSIILLVAISIHSIFEGIAVGLQPTTTDVVGVFAALSLHKCLLAFGLGLQLAESSLSRMGAVRAAAFFVLSSPVGIGIGMLVEISGDSKHTIVADAILQGFACGTFLYVIFFEVLPHEFNELGLGSQRILKVLFLLLGFACFSAVLFLDADLEEQQCVIVASTRAP